MLAYEVDLNQVSFSKYALSVLYGGLIGGRGAIFFPGLDNKSTNKISWLYSIQDMEINEKT
jgi:hypothetical protein